jgi:hypothetical protein
MTDIPRIFSDNGALIAIDPATLDAPMRERYAAIVATHAANQQAEQKLADANAEVRDAVSAVRNTEDYYNARWPRQTFYELWKENFTGDDYARSGRR